MEAVTRQKRIRGLDTAWLEAGGDAAAAKPILLLLHGFPDAPESWEHQIVGFAPDFHVVAPYGRGAGPSEKSDDLGRYGPDGMALDVLAILDEVDPTRERKIYIVGHDLGAVHAWHVAGLLQHRAARLVIINGLTIGQMARRWNSPRQLARSWYIFLAQIPRVPELLFRRFPEPLLRFAHKKGGLSPEQSPSLEDVRESLVGPLNQYRAFLREAPGRLLGGKDAERTVACPVLVLWGADDAFILPPTVDELRAEAPDLTVRILQGNHWLQREQPERVNKLMSEFFVA